MHIFFVDTKHCESPHRVTDATKLAVITNSIEKGGWNGPPLVGYFNFGSFAERNIKLLSGTHRLAAAAALGIKVPVEVYTMEQAKEKWGKPEWMDMMTPSVLIRHIYDKEGHTEIV